MVAFSRLPEVQTGDKERCDALFSDFLKHYPTYANIGLTDSGGTIYASAIPITSPVSASDRAYFQRALRKRDFAIGDYQFGRISHQPTLNFSYPIIDSSGKFHGVVFVALNLSWMTTLAQQVQLPQAATMMVVDSSGLILARSTGAEKWVGRVAPDAPILKSFAGQREGSVKVDGIDGVRTLYAFKQLRGGDGPSGTYVCVVTPLYEAFAQVRYLLFRNLAWLGIATLLMMAATWFLGDALFLRRIHSLLEATRRLSMGDLGVRTGQGDAGGEMGDLARAFDEMAASLEQRSRERMKAEQALKDGEERMQRIFQDAAVGMVVSSTEMVILQANRAFCEFLGYPEQELAGKTVDEITHPEDRALSRDATLRSMEGGAPIQRFEKRYVRRDGGIRWGEVGISMVRDPAGRSSYFVVQVLDITERKQVEETFRQQHLELERANHAKDEFIAMLSHELRTPLTPILTCVDSFQRDPGLPGEIREAFAMIRRNAQLEALLIDDLLDVARVTFGKIDLHLEPVDAHAVLRDALETCHPVIQQKQLAVTLDLRANPSMIQAESIRLQQAIWNLINNSVKFTPDHGTLTIRSANPQPDSIALEFIDNGEGMDPEIQERIFNPFEQGRRQFGSGLGLGLAIAKGIVTAHGGSLTARSDGPGKGSTFCMVLKTCCNENPARHVESAAIQSGKTALPVRILLVEDHDDTREMTARLLARRGYTVQTSADLKGAFARSSAWEFDLLVSDVGLPDGSGLDLMKKLRNTKPDLRGIAMSGFGMPSDIRKSKEAGFAEHFIKPVHFDKLEEAIRKLTQNGGVRMEEKQ